MKSFTGMKHDRVIAAENLVASNNLLPVLGNDLTVATVVSSPTPGSIDYGPSILISNDSPEVEVIDLDSFEFEGSRKTPKTSARTCQ